MAAEEEREMSEVLPEEILKPFHKMPVRNAATVLLVGSYGTGTQQLAKSMVDVCTDTGLKLQVRTTTSLPLPEENTDTRPRIDYIVFIIDLTNRLSFSTVKSAVQCVDVEYFLGRACFVVTNAKGTSDQCVEMEEVSRLADMYNTMYICGAIKEGDSDERTTLANRLLRLVEVSAGRKNVSPLLVDLTCRQLCFQEEQTEFYTV
ncbi:centromere protein M-like [Branchiostoma lanceolatum]|uniref:centromere protein M-like n=1 Tax=Branchiostoma lanceolatum TaxID=7740 RepID=UPI0034525036